MTERILQHKKPDDVPFSIKRYLGDKWDRISKWQKGYKCCLDCGLPTMRLVYQESEVYTMLCMACGMAHRYYANDVAKAEQVDGSLEMMKKYHITYDGFGDETYTFRLGNSPLPLERGWWIVYEGTSEVFGLTIVNWRTMPDEKFHHTYERVKEQ